MEHALDEVAVQGPVRVERCPGQVQVVIPEPVQGLAGEAAGLGFRLGVAEDAFADDGRESRGGMLSRTEWSIFRAVSAAS